MAQITVKIEGAAKIQRELRRLGAKLGKDAVMRVLEKAAEPIRDSAKLGSFRDHTGELRRGITIMSQNYWVDPTVVVTTSKKAFYAHMVEFGTVKMGARPFMGPALENNRTLAFGIIRSETARLLGL